MNTLQTTIAQDVTFKGQGLHSGNVVTITCKPAGDNHGIIFQRIDLEGKPLIPALVQYVADTSRSTSIAHNGATVQTIEHLMAALVGCGIDNALIEIDATELPILDGSASYYIREFLKVGVTTLQAARKALSFDKPYTYEIPEKGIVIDYKPSSLTKITVNVDYNSEVLRPQAATLNHYEDFPTEVGCARTFVFLHELTMLMKYGLVKGGDVDNAIVFVDTMPTDEELRELATFFNKEHIEVTQQGILSNVTLHFDNEPARHKLLDLIGDLYLLGAPVRGEITASRPGHFANTEFVKGLLNQ